MMDFLEEEESRASCRTELLTSTLANKHSTSSYVPFVRAKIKRSKSLPHELNDLTKVTELRETHEYRFYPLESFPHFQYVYDLVYDCYCRLKEADILGPDEIDFCFLKPKHELVIKIDFIGILTQERLKLVSNVEGKEERNGKTVWSESPLICFQTDATGHNMRPCHTLIVKNDLKDAKKMKMDSQVRVIEHDQEKIRKAICICIEKGLADYIERSMNMFENIKHGLREDLREFYLEMKSIFKHVMLEESTLQHTCMTKRNDYYSIPSDIKDLLSREPYVNSFGIWEDATFKIFVDENADPDNLREKIKGQNKSFSERFKVQIEKKKFVMKCATQLKQGGELHRHTFPEKGVDCGTLGGFVKDTRSSESCREAYALTCNHLYPTTNTAAYATIDGEEKEVGKCIFTTRENSCDFAVVEINKDVLDKCDLKFRRDDEKKCNAEVSEYFPINVGIVHKNGSETKWTRGRIVSSAFYDAVNNKEVFVVKGLDRRPFSTLGDSGSIVFARDNSVTQDTVDVLGMVYSNNPDSRDNTGHSECEEEKARGPSGHSEGILKSGIDQSYCKLKDADKSKSDQSLASGTNPQIKSKSRENPENYSFCFRMNNAFELLEKEKNLLVSFERVENSSADI